MTMESKLLKFYRDQVRAAQEDAWQFQSVAAEAELKKAQFHLQRLEDSLSGKPQYLARRHQEGK